MDSTKRFSDRVAEYVAHRPGYPPAVLDLLAERCGLAAETRVADVGSGTGILTKLLLDRGAKVWAVEPNQPMRAAAETALGGIEGFTSVDATAESMPLPEASIDLYTASQAFHWFDGASARAECLRVLKPGGWAALIWNGRQEDSTPFLHAYEDLLESLPSYREVRHQDLPGEEIASFLGPDEPELHVFPNAQSLDWPSLLGRAASSSYFPRPDSRLWDGTVARLREIFARFAENGRVDFLYDCKAFLGRPRT